MRSGTLLAACLAVLAAPPVSGAERITAANWRRHPAIVEIRAIYLKASRAEAAGLLRNEQRTFEYCKPYEDAERTLYRDGSGAARSYHALRGSEDSAAQAAFYYDQVGALRFVFVKAGAYNGTAHEYRVYLSRAGERLWQERRDLKGPGWGFPAQLSDDWLIRDPVTAFYVEHPCTEGNIYAK